MECICRVIKTSDGTGYFLTIRCVLFRISDTENWANNDKWEG